MSKKNKMWKRSLNHSLAYVFFLQFSFMQGVFASSSTNESGETQTSGVKKESSFTQAMISGSSTGLREYNVSQAPLKEGAKKYVGFDVNYTNQDAALNRIGLVWDTNSQNLGFDLNMHAPVSFPKSHIMQNYVPNSNKASYDFNYKTSYSDLNKNLSLYAYDSSLNKENKNLIREIYRAAEINQINAMIEKQIADTNAKYADYDKTGKSLHYLKGKAKTVAELTIRFPKDSALFFAAIGMVMYAQLYTHYEGNPLAMEQHVASLTDPMANLAFYSFILANGLKNESFTRTGYTHLDKARRVQAFKLLNYKGLVWGMLASNIASEVGMSIKTCTAGISGIAAEADKGKLLSACEETLRMWSLPKIVNRYTPLLASLLTSQYLSELMMRGIHKVKGAAQPALAYAFEGLTVRLMTTPGGGLVFGAGQVVGKLLPIVNTVFMFAAFVGLDHLIMPIISTGWTTLVYPFRKYDNKSQMQKCIPYFENNHKGKGFYTNTEYDSDCNKDFVHAVLDWRDFSNDWRNAMNGQFETGYFMWVEMITDLFNQYASTEQFYMMLVQEYESELLNKREGQYVSTHKNHFSRIHYLNGVLVMPSYFDNEDMRDLSELSKEEKQALVKQVNDLRFGNPGVLDEGTVKFGGVKLNNGRMGLIEHSIKSKKFPSVDSFKGSWIEKLNLRGIGFCQKAGECLSVHASKENEEKKLFLTKWKEIENNLTTGDVRTKGLALYEINRLIHVLPKNDKVVAALKNYMNYLGQPEPIFHAGAGLPYVYSQTSSNQEALTSKKWSFPSEYVGTNLHLKRDTRYVFDNAAYYFTHETLCGKDVASIRQTKGFKAHFSPPSMIDKRLLKDTTALQNFCFPQVEKSNNSERTYEKLNYRHSFSKKYNFFGKGEVYGPISSLAQGFDKGLLKKFSCDGNNNCKAAVEGASTNEIKDLELEINQLPVELTEKNGFELWWMEKSLKPLNEYLDKQHEYYKKLYAYLDENLSNHVRGVKSISLSSAIDGAHGIFKYIGKNMTDAGFSVLDSLRFELKMYERVMVSISRTQEQKELLAASMKRYESVLNFLVQRQNVMTSSMSQKEESEKIQEAKENLSSNKMALAAAYENVNSENKLIAPQDEKVYLALKYGFENIDANLEKYLMAKELLRYDPNARLNEHLDMLNKAQTQQQKMKGSNPRGGGDY